MRSREEIENCASARVFVERDLCWDRAAHSSFLKRRREMELGSSFSAHRVADDETTRRIAYSISRTKLARNLLARSASAKYCHKGEIGKTERRGEKTRCLALSLSEHVARVPKTREFSAKRSNPIPRARYFHYRIRVHTRFRHDIYSSIT